MRKHLLLAFAIMSVVSCSKTELAQESNKGIIKFNVIYPQTKARATGFEINDAISLYAVEYDGIQKMPLQMGGNYFNNEKVVFDGIRWIGVRSLYWSTKACDFYALYPYQNSVQDVDAYPFSVRLDQTGAGLEQSDLLFAGAENVVRGDSGVDLQFQHMMSKLVVNLVEGPKFEGKIPDDVVAHIYNTNVDCNVNISKGVVEKSAFGAKRTITMKKNSNHQFEAVVVPQNVETRTPLIELTMGGIAYLLDYSISFRAGYVYTINVTLNTSPDQEQIEISIDPGVNPWG